MVFRSQELRGIYPSSFATKIAITMETWRYN